MNTCLLQKTVYGGLRAHVKKSGVDFEIPLMELPLRILKKYRDIAPEGKLLPMYSNCVLNYHLKHIAENLRYKA